MRRVKQLDRPAAHPELLLRGDAMKDPPIGRDGPLTEELEEGVTRRMEAKEYGIVEVDIDTRELPPEEHTKTALGLEITEAGVVKVQLGNPPSISLEEIERFDDWLTGEVFDILDRLNYRTNQPVGFEWSVLPRIRGDYLRAKRLYTTAELVVHVTGLDDANLSDVSEREIEAELSERFSPLDEHVDPPFDVAIVEESDMVKRDSIWIRVAAREVRLNSFRVMRRALADVAGPRVGLQDPALEIIAQDGQVF